MNSQIHSLIKDAEAILKKKAKWKFSMKCFKILSKKYKQYTVPEWFIYGTQIMPTEGITVKKMVIQNCVKNKYLILNRLHTQNNPNSKVLKIEKHMY